MEYKKAETGKSILKNSLFGLSTFLLPLALSFFATPILVRNLGTVDYGLYTLVLGFVSYSFNFNIARAITKFVAEYRSSGKSDQISGVISATFFLNVFVGSIGALIIYFTADWLVSDVFQISAEAQQKTIISLYLAAAIVFSTVMMQVFNSVLHGIHRFDVYSKVYNFNVITLISGNIVLAVFGYGMIALLLWNLAVSLVTGLIYLYIAKKLLPEFAINFGFPKSTLKLVLKFSYGVVGYQVLANFLFLFEKGWITRKLGPEALTFYAVAMMLGVYIHSLISSLLIVVFPLASELKDNPERLLMLYKKSTKIVCLLVAFISATLIVQSKQFLTLWMNDAFADQASVLLIIHTITFSALAVQIVSWQMTEGLGFPAFNFKMFLIALIITIIGMFFLTDKYGTVGVAFAHMTGFSFLLLSIFYVEKWFFKSIQFSFWLKTASVLLLSAILSSIIQIGINRLLSVSWLTFFVSTFCGGIAYCLVAWILGFVAAEERLMVKNIFRRRSLYEE